MNMMSNTYRKTIGRLGEDAASVYLEKKGYEILARNFRCREGEIDLIAKDQEWLVFVEVKSRTSIKYGYGREAVTPRKQAKIIDVAQHYLLQLNNYEIPCRFDVIEVDLFQGDVVSIEHYQDAFTA
jgi:putative endonuclease